jgi:hypothetical protein
MCNSGIFWGILVIVFGIGLLVKHIFNLDFPVFKVVLGLALVLIGIRIILSKSVCRPHHDNWSDKDNSVVFSNKQILFNEAENEYNVVFSSSVLDFTKIDTSTEHKIKLNCVFGDMKILVNPRTKVILESDVVFGNVSNPEETQYSPEGIADSNQIVLKLKTSAVFGTIKIIRKEL